MQLFARRRRRTRLVLAAAGVLAAAAIAVAVWPSDEAAVPPVPTVPVEGTPVDVVCVDPPAGTVTDAGTDSENSDISESATAADWYNDGAAGVVALDADISASSPTLGFLADLMLDHAADTFGGYATSAIRDLSPFPDCPTHHYVEVVLRDGSELVLQAWRSAAAAAPRSLVNEAAFVVVDDRTLASDGPHVVSVLTVAPDGTSVLITAFGAGAKDALTRTNQLISVPLDPSSWGAAPATVEQLRPLAADALAVVSTRAPAG